MAREWTAKERMILLAQDWVNCYCAAYLEDLLVENIAGEITRDTSVQLGGDTITIHLRLTGDQLLILFSRVAPSIKFHP